MSDAEGMTIECSEVFDISVVTDFKAMVQQALADGSDLVLDGSHIERVDTAALQLLAALFRDSEHQGIKLSWKTPAEPLKYAARLTGLDGLLGL